MALTGKDIGIILGGQFIGKGITKVADWVDAQYAPGKPALERPGTWINLGGGIGLIVGSYLGLKRYPTAQTALAIAGSHMLTRVVDLAEEVTGAPTATFVPTGTFVSAPAPASVVATAPAVKVGKYA